jgi:cysteine desulfurase
MTIKLPIYLDYQSTTPVDPRVADAVSKSLIEDFGNPHSRTHSFGWIAEEKVEIARKQIADLINADPKEIFFTSGATESNNIAIKGVANFYKNSGKNHIITVLTEHKCVIETCRNSVCVSTYSVHAAARSELLIYLAMNCFLPF